jgi:hypothetical protein
MTEYCSPDMLAAEQAEAEQALDRLSNSLGRIQYSNMLHLGYTSVTLEQCIAAQRNALIKSIQDDDD